MEIEQEMFTPLVFTTTGGMADECVKYHSRLAELIANNKGEVTQAAIFLDKSESACLSPSHALRYYALEAQKTTARLC